MKDDDQAHHPRDAIVVFVKHTVPRFATTMWRWMDWHIKTKRNTQAQKLLKQHTHTHTSGKFVSDSILP